MFILELFDWAEIFAKVYGLLRKILFLIDSLGLTFIDDAYDLMISAITAFDGDKVAQLANDIAKNCYIIIGIFALFRIAVILVNTIIDPDKLTDKSQGFGNVLMRLVVTLVLFVMVPFIFDMSRDLQSKIIDNSYISKILIGTDLTGGSSNNAGTVVKDIAVRSLIYPDEEFYDKKTEEIKCTDACETAIKNWEGNASYEVISYHLPDYVMVNDSAVYVYKYTPIIVLLVGGFITYVLFSFAIDIAIRSVELAVLEILAPMFLVTYIDPKSSSSGPFKKWLTACGKTYLNLFIKIAVICLMLLFISKLNDLFDTASESTGLLQLLVYIAILIFAKRAPKWLGDMLGIDGSSLGGLGIGKKLGEAALIGGALTKGIGAAKGAAKKGADAVKGKGKNFLGNRARNTLARVGGMREAASINKARKKNSADGNYQRESLWRQGRAAAKQSKADNYGKDIKGLKDVTAGYMAGRKNLNPQAQTIRENWNDKFQLKNAAFQAKIGNTDAKRAEAMDFAKNNKVASKLYSDKKLKMDLSGNGDRLKVKNAAGKEVYLNPQGAKEMNAAFGHPRTANDAFREFGRNLATNQGLTINGDNVVMKDGKQITLAEYGSQNMSRSGRLAVDNLVAENVEKDVANYKNSRENLDAANQNLFTLNAQRNQSLQNYNADSRVTTANEIIEQFPASQSVIKAYETAKATITKITDNPDYKKLAALKEKGEELPIQDVKRLQEYEVQLKVQRDIVASNETKYSHATEVVSKYNDAQVTLDTVKREYNIEGMEKQIAEAAKVAGDWQLAVSEYEERFEKAVSNEFDIETGEIKKGEFNPYKVEVPGVGKFDVVKDYIRINEITTSLNIKSSKTKKKYEESIKDPE